MRGALQQRAALGRADALSAEEALRLATIGGARALGLADTIGSLEPGKAADLAAWRLDAHPRAVGAGDLPAALVFALAGLPADHVTVAGRTLVRHGALLHPDARGIADRVRATADRLRAWDLAARPARPARPGSA